MLLFQYELFFSLAMYEQMITKGPFNIVRHMVIICSQADSGKDFIVDQVL